MTADIIAFPDPLVVLKAKWDGLMAECYYAADYGDPGEADAISLRCVEIEDRISELVPRSAAGAAVQVWRLQHLGDFEWGAHQDHIAANLIAGLEHIGEAQP
jgi:hypothetical protein